MTSVLGLLVASLPLASAQAENINIYGWQNWSYEWVDADNGKEVDRLSNNAANIGFMAHMDTGIDGLQVGFRCEQFTYWGRNNKYTDWCNRNSKISLRHETAGEIMFGQWLLPYNEIVAAWVDPFYDAGADSHTSIMGNLGQNAGVGITGCCSNLFYNGSFDDDFTAGYGALAFNRRQEGVIQYFWPNIAKLPNGYSPGSDKEGFQFRFAITEGSATDTKNAGGHTLDERIWSTGVSYQRKVGSNNQNQIWFAAAYEQHDDVSALAATVACSESEDKAYRIAGRYFHDWGTGQKTQIAAMYEELDYDADNCETLTFNDDGIITNRASATPVWADVKRDAWMISGKHSFGEHIDLRFSYMDADDWECGSKSNNCIDAGGESGTDADALNIGLYYTMLNKITSLRLTYSEVDNSSNAQYDFGINGAFPGSPGSDVDMWAVGIVHWFD